MTNTEHHHLAQDITHILRDLPQLSDYLWHPAIYQPSEPSAALFTPGPLRREEHGLPDELYSLGHHRTPSPLLFSVAAAGRSEWFQGDHLRRRYYTNVSIELVTHGAGLLTVGRKRFQLARGNLFLLLPNEAHAYRATSLEPFKKSFVIYDAAAPLHRRAWELTRLLSVNHIPLDPDAARRVELIIERIISIIKDRGPAGAFPASLAGYELVAELIHIRQHCATPDGVPEMLHRLMHSAVLHLHDGITAHDLAREAGLSRDHLSRLFRLHTGMSVRTWLHHLRMSLAAHLLLRTRWKVHSIGDFLGYPNPYSFTRAFSHASGLSPEEFRRRWWSSSRTSRPKPR